MDGEATQLDSLNTLMGEPSQDNTPLVVKDSPYTEEKPSYDKLNEIAKTKREQELAPRYSKKTQAITEQDPGSFLNFVGSTFMETSSVGALIDLDTIRDISLDKKYTEQVDINYKPSEDPEIVPLLSGLTKNEAEVMGAYAYSTDMAKDLYNNIMETRIRVQEMAAYSNANPIRAFAGGLVGTALDPANYLVPHGAVAGALGKMTGGLIKLNKVIAGMTTGQALVRRLLVTALDTGVEEAALQGFRSQVAMRPEESITTSAIQAMIVGSAFSSVVGSLKGVKDHNLAITKLRRQLDVALQDTIDESIVSKIDDLISKEDTNISVEGQLSTKYRDSLIALRDAVQKNVDDSKLDRARNKYMQAVVEHRNRLKGVADGERIRRIEEANLNFDDTISKARTEADTKIAELYNSPKPKNVLKKQKNNINRQYKALEARAKSQLDDTLKIVEADYNTNLKKYSESELPIEAKQAYKEYMDMKGGSVEDIPLEATMGVYSQGWGSAGAMKAKVDKFSYEKLQTAEYHLPNTDEAKLFMEFGKDNKAVQLTPDLLKHLSNGRFDPHGFFGGLVANKNTASLNEIFSQFYNVVSPSYGRKEGTISVVELKDRLNSVLATPLDEAHTKMMNRLGKELKRPLSFFSLEKQKDIHDILDQYIHAPERFEARTDLSDNFKSIIRDAADDIDVASSNFIERVKNSGMKGTENLQAVPRTIHRKWNHEFIREIEAKHGTAAIEDIVAEAFISYKMKNPELSKSGSLATDIEKFTFGLLNVDKENFRDTQMTARILRKLKEAGVEDQKINKKLENFDARIAKSASGLTGQAAPIDLGVSVLLPDGTELFMYELLHSNPFWRQQNLIANNTGKIAFAEMGFKDIDKVDEFLRAGYELERNRNGLKRADALYASAKSDLSKIAGIPMDVAKGEDPTWTSLLDYLKTWNFNRVLQYAPISSYGELGGIGADTGYLNLGKTYALELSKTIAKRFGLMKPEDVHNELMDSMRPFLGVGFESIGFNPLISTGSALAKSSKGQKLERLLLNEPGRLTRALAPIETFNRKVAANAMATGLFNKIKTGKKASLFWGGITDTNLVEMGLGTFKDRKFVGNDTYNRIVSAMDKASVDKSGNLVNFNFKDWDVSTREAFLNGFTKLMNHSIVNADSTTSKRWHTDSIFGNLTMQFKSFDVNAMSKVAGRMTTNTYQSLGHGDYLETVKAAQKLIYGMGFGKMALLATASLRYAGRDDYMERLSSYIWDDDHEIGQWFTALSRTSSFTWLRNLEDLGLVQNVSTYSRVNSLNPFRMPFESATGQLIEKGLSIPKSVKDGDFGTALDTTLSLTPFYRAPLINIPFNMLSDALKANR